MLVEVWGEDRGYGYQKWLGTYELGSLYTTRHPEDYHLMLRCRDHGEFDVIAYRHEADEWGNPPVWEWVDSHPTDETLWTQYVSLWVAPVPPEVVCL